MLSLPSCPSPLGALRPLPSDSRTVIFSGVVRLSGFAESEDSGRAALRYSLTSEPRPWPHHHDRALPASPWHLLRSLHTLAVRLTWICPTRGAPVGPSEPAQAPSSWSDSAGQTQSPSINPSLKGSPALTHLLRTCLPSWVGDSSSGPDIPQSRPPLQPRPPGAGGWPRLEGLQCRAAPSRVPVTARQLLADQHSS